MGEQGESKKESDEQKGYSLVLRMTIERNQNQ